MRNMGTIYRFYSSSSLALQRRWDRSPDLYFCVFKVSNWTVLTETLFNTREREGVWVLGGLVSNAKFQCLGMSWATVTMDWRRGREQSQTQERERKVVFLFFKGSIYCLRSLTFFFFFQKNNFILLWWYLSAVWRVCAVHVVCYY